MCAQVAHTKLLWYLLLFFFDIREIKGVVHLKKKKLLLIIYSPPCHPRYPRLSFFSRKEIEVFDENIPGFSPYNGLQWEPNGSRSK